MFSRFGKKFLGFAAALSISCMFMFPAPRAEASILTGIISSGIQYIELNNQLNYYNDKGRNEFFKELEAKYGVNSDPALNTRLTRIMKNLSESIATIDPSIEKKPYNYFINKQTSFNAFCTLGHNMSVNTGLFSLLNNEDEIAVVLGHEMGHGQKDHPVKGFQRSLPYELIAQIYASSKGGSSIAAGIFANYATATQVTKPQEWEADNLAFEYITHSNYNPGACAAIWQRVIEKQGNGGSTNFAGEIFSPSDHPTNQQRRDNYAQKLYEFSNKKVAVKDGMIQINGKDFIKPSAVAGMSSQERAYFVAGNLSAVYHQKKTIPAAHVENGVVLLGAQPIIQPLGNDNNAVALAAQLNQIK